MTKLLRVTSNVQMFYDEEGRDAGLNIPNERATRSIKTFSRHGNYAVNIDPGDTENLTFGDVDSVQGFMLEVDGTLEVTINGADTALVLTPPAGTNTKASLLLEAPITSVSITSPPTGNPRKGLFAFWGDPEA